MIQIQHIVLDHNHCQNKFSAVPQVTNCAGLQDTQSFLACHVQKDSLRLQRWDIKVRGISIACFHEVLKRYVFELTLMEYLFGEVHANRISINLLKCQKWAIRIRFLAVIVEAILDLYLPNAII